jgi:hypothetical protein
VQLLPNWSGEKIFVELPRRARPTVVTLVGLALPALNTQRKRALVIANGEQERRPFARGTRGVFAHFGDGRGDGVELRALLRIAAIFDETGQRLHGRAHPSRVIAFGESESRKTQG